MRFNRTKAGALSVAAVAAAAFVAAPGTASAAFGPSYDTQCENAESIVGRGASFQRALQLVAGARILAPDPAAALRSGFGYDVTTGCAAFKLAVDGGTRTIAYAPAGSGAGRTAFGANGVVNSRPVSPAAYENYGGVDEAPTDTQRRQANAGDTGVAYDNAELNTIPIGSSSIAVDVRLPAGCSVTNANRQLTATAVERAFAGDDSFDTWGELFPSLAGACASAPVNRVVRYDRSGSTYAFKQFLQAVATAYSSGTDWREPDSGGSLANLDWPDRSRQWYTSNQVNGAGALLDAANGLLKDGRTTVLARDNSASTTTLPSALGYADLPTSRDREYGYGSSTNDSSDERFWVRTQRLDATDGRGRTFVSPAVFGGDTQTGTRGSNCANVTYSNVPAATTDSWYDVQGFPTRTDYPACALTYALAWTDPKPFNLGYNGNTNSLLPFTEGQQRATKDYLNFVINGGQALLAGSDYSRLPVTILAKAQTGVNSLTY